MPGAVASATAGASSAHEPGALSVAAPAAAVTILFTDGHLGHHFLVLCMGVGLGWSVLEKPIARRIAESGDSPSVKRCSRRGVWI